MTLLRTAGFAACVTLLSGPAFAQTDALTLSSLTVTRYDTMPNIDPDLASPCCALHTYESGEAEDFIYIDANFAVAWSDELERVQVRASDIGLQLDNETEARSAWGRFNFFPEVERGGNSLNARRPRDWPEENAGGHLDLVFSVPTGATSATLVIGEGEETMRIPVDLNVPVSEVPEPSSFFDVAISGISASPELVTEDRIGRTNIPGRIVPRLGEIVRVDISVTALQNINVDAEPGENASFFTNTDFALIGPAGYPLLPLGRSVSGSVRNRYSNSISWDGEGASNPVSVTLFFLGAGTAGDYELFFFNETVGKVTLAE
ncbi:hypothetical protein [Gymnodinialimonas hymeniacidonis]|uniref:hypothetical protein n=1 Tax=Gymnodinialimonas hymeniacidonis TaxID=3126508 RepID=UPI0034C6C2B9